MSVTVARRIGWGSVLLASALVVTAGALLAWAGSPAAGAPAFVASNTGPFTTLLMGLGLVLLFGGTGALIVARYPSNLLGWTFVLGAVMVGLTLLGSAYGYAGLVARPGSLPAARVITLFLGEVMWLPLISLQLVALLVLFPDGRLATPGRRRIAWIGVVGLLIGSIGATIGPTLYGVEVANPLAVRPDWISGTFATIGFTLVVGAGLAAMVSLVGRFRRSRGDERQQMKWFVFAAGLSIAVELPINFTEASATWIQLLGAAAAALVPVAVGIAILRYRLYDIDVVINRTVVYGILAAFITLVFLALVVGVGTLVGGGSTFLAAVAAAVVAIVFQPVRRWAQHLANRLVYGARATPYEVLSGFSDRLAETYSLEDVLPRMARILGEGVGAARVSIALDAGGARSEIAAWPEEIVPADDVRSFEVRHQGRPLGTIAVSLRPGEQLDAGREKLVRDVAAQAGLVLRNVRLIEELRESRRRIVAAQDERAKKLERDIHDGAQQQLVALAVKQRISTSLIGRDEERLRSILEELAADTNETLEDLRDLARGIYPPLLADKGLPAALEGQARKSPVPVSVLADGIGRFAQATEAAVYFSCLEALQNVAKYAHASSATVRLAQANGHLTFEVSDDGVGFDPDAVERGTGLQGIADRLAALGGELTIRSRPGDGTTLAGRLPVEVSA
jgi:signal transduction histidine kinase